MTDDTILKLGKLIEGDCGRDAIHIAVAPMIAAERLSPGQHVGLIGVDHAGRTETPIGIVDPFLQIAVMKGDRFSTVSLDYHGGLRYPHLERIAGSPALLDDVLAPRP